MRKVLVRIFETLREFWNREEVLMTYDLTAYNRGKALLSDNGIPYTTRFRSSNRWQTGRIEGAIGSMGQSTAYEVTYKIYTKREWAERARYILRNQH